MRVQHRPNDHAGDQDHGRTKGSGFHSSLPATRAGSSGSPAKRRMRRLGNKLPARLFLGIPADAASGMDDAPLIMPSSIARRPTKMVMSSWFALPSRSLKRRRAALAFKYSGMCVMSAEHDLNVHLSILRNPAIGGAR